MLYATMCMAESLLLPLADTNQGKEFCCTVMVLRITRFTTHVLGYFTFIRGAALLLIQADRRCAVLNVAIHAAFHFLSTLVTSLAIDSDHFSSYHQIVK